MGQRMASSVGEWPYPSENSDRPGDDFNRRGDVRVVLEQFGWSRVRDGENEYWRRPGKDSGTSATLKDRVFYVFSSNAPPFEPNRGYSPFAVYSLLCHGGDYAQAAKALGQLGFGSDSLADSADISAIVRMSGSSGDCSSDHGDIKASLVGGSDSGPPIQRLRGLIDDFEGLNAPVIYGLLREGETMNIIASPKIGKSWFVSSLAVSIASGLDWLGLKVEQGRVLHIDNELHACTSAYRYQVISEAMGVSHHLYSDNIDVVSLRGHLRDLRSMGDLFEVIEPGHYRLVIIDAFYRTLPKDTDENDNGAMAKLYNHIDGYAARLGCAFVLIHHSSKGNQSGKAVTDVGAGAGSQSRAADTHLILRPHEEENIVVMDSALRSWPPMEPMALNWQWPLFAPVDGVDTSALLGMAKPKGKNKDVSVEEFVDHCVARHDPCSQTSIVYEARQQLGLSERKARNFIEVALEEDLIMRLRIGSKMKYVKIRGGISGEKGQWIAAMLAHKPDGNIQNIAETVGVTRQYINQIRRSIGGNYVETDGN